MPGSARIDQEKCGSANFQAPTPSTAFASAAAGCSAADGIRPDDHSAPKRLAALPSPAVPRHQTLSAIASRLIP